MINLPDTFKSMIRSIFLISAFLFLSNTLFAQADDTLRRADPNGWEFIQVVRGKTIVAEGQLHNSVREGVWTEYWENKVPHYVTTYKSGKREGMYMDMRRNGLVELVQYYKNDKLDGPAR